MPAKDRVAMRDMTPLMSSRSTAKILVIGGTGMIGRYLVTASLDAGHPTAVLVRRPAAAEEDPARASLLEAFKSRGATLIYGDMNDGEALVAAIKQAGDVVISAVGHSSPEEVESQLRIVGAIKQAGNVQRFLPSEYGCDVAHAAEHMVEPARSILGAKVRVRHALKAAGIPHTIICSNWAQSFLLQRAGDPQADGPPDTTATIFGDGQVQESAFPLNFQLAIVHATFVAAGRSPAPGPTNKNNNKKKTTAEEEVDATQLYPGMRYITVKDYLDSLPPHCI